MPSEATPLPLTFKTYVLNNLHTLVVATNSNDPQVDSIALHLALHKSTVFEVASFVNV